jgi:hypothetical protein
VTHAPRGLLIEEARTNVLFPSVIGGSWGPLGAALGGSVTTPDGATSTTALVGAIDTTNSVRQFYLSGIPVSATTTYTLTTFFKAGPVNAYFQINVTGGTTCVSVAYYDLTAGTAVVGADLAAGLTGRAVSITAVGNGWYRCSFTFTTVAGNTALQVAIGLCTVVSGTGDNRSYVGVVGQGIYAWGVQVEAGAFATSYIATTTAAVTRAQDQCYAAIGAWFNPSTYSLSADFDTAVPTSFYAGIGDSNINNGTWLTNTGFTRAGGGSAAAVGTVTAGASNKMCGTINNATSVGVCLNGGATGSAANSSAAQTTATYLSVGMGPWAFDHVINGHVRRIRYWPRVLSAAELQSVTT